MDDPWNIQSLFELQFFVCPACEYKNNSKQEFVYHAYNVHPESSDKLKIINDDSINDINCPWKKKESITIFEEQKDDCQNGEIFEIKEDPDLLDESGEEEKYVHKENNSNCENVLMIENEFQTLEVDVETKSIDPLELVTKREIKNTNKFPKCDSCGKYFSDEKKLVEHSCGNIADSALEIKKDSQKENLQQHLSKPESKKPLKKGNYKNCDLCGKSVLDLKKHISDAHADKVKCDFCSNFYNAKRLNRHIARIHEGLKPFKCDVCGVHMADKSNLQRHIKVMHKSIGEHDCKLCEKIFITPYELKQHLLSVHEFSEKLKNPLANNRIRSFRENFHECKLCGKTVSSAPSLRNHIKTVYEGRKDYKCDSCGKLYKQSAGLKHHINAAHEGKKVIQCESCGISFYNIQSLKRHHRTIHEGIKNYQCKECGKSFGHSNSLSDHIKRIHEGIKDPESFCQYCGKSYSSERHLRTHIKSVHEENHKCDSCGKYFSLKAYLRSHIYIVHEGHKDHKCESCGKSYSRKKILKAHIESVHEGKKEHKCDSCVKCFGRKKDLDRHINTVHKGIKNYKCCFCNTAFGQSGDMKRHIKRIHSQEKEKQE